MKIRLFVIAVAVLLVSLLATAALAQYGDETVSKINIKLGMHRIMDSADRSLLGGTWWSQEAMYDFKSDGAGRPVGRVTLGYFSSGSSGTGSMISANLNNIWWKDSDSNNSFYAGGGIGINKMKLLGVDSTKPGAQVFGGYTFGSGYFAELRLIVVPSWRVAPNLDINTSGLNLSIGTRQLF